MIDQAEIHKKTQGEDVVERGEFSLHKTEIQKLEEILYDIEKQKSFRTLGYILIPIILGFFILKKTNENIYILTKRKDELKNKVINEIGTSSKQLKNTLKHLTDEDTFLIYSVRTDLLSKLEEYGGILYRLKLQ